MASEVYPQSGVIPYRIRKGEPQFLLITSRSGKKWVIPKGLVEPDLSPLESARKEAIEEAGIEGDVEDRILGYYEYEKWSGLCRVRVYSMKVTSVNKSWLEDFREREWVSLNTAMKRVSQGDLAKLIKDLDTSLRRKDLH